MPRLPAVRALWAALAFGVLFVAFYDGMLAPVRYPYAADSASYIEMADSLYHEGRPRVTPWDLEFPHDDRIAQRLFPPGFPLLVAAFIPVAGDAAAASLWPSRLAAALLPLLIVLAFRGALGERALVVVACFALATAGVRGWQFLAYSDVAALALAVLALGTLARGLGLLDGAGPRRGWLFAAGGLAGAAYGMRNAGLAVLAAGVLVLALDAWRARRVAPGGWWLAGAGGPMAALWAYNLATFGQWQPYTMPASQRPWHLNIGDYALAQVTDFGLPWQLAEHTPAAVATVLMGAFALAIALAWWRLRTAPRRQLLLTVLAGYGFGGALLLVLSRSRYEWGNQIDVRNTLQYTWALGFAGAYAVAMLGGDRLRAATRIGGSALLVLLVATAVAEVVGVRRNGAEFWQMLHQDPAVLSAPASEPASTLLASNDAVLFRIGSRRPVRQLEISGNDRDFRGSLELLARTAAPRPAVLYLVCDDYTRGYTACGGEPAPGVAPPACAPVRRVAPRVYACRPDPLG
jgi:hypothetical protein